MISYSAPGKIILSGEHSVVYTKPAFVTAVDFHLIFHINTVNSKSNATIDPAVLYCENIVASYLRKNSITFTKRQYSYSIESTIPKGRGMGSSAAFCVAVVASLLHFYTGKQYDKQIINSLAYQCEKYFHGNPSGVDVSTSCFGGLIFYRKEFEFLKTISSLNFKIPKSFQDKMILIDTGKPEESTSEMISYVGKRYNLYPKKTERVLSDIERVTKRMVVGVVKEDIKMFTQAIEENQKLLVELGIVSKKTISLLESLKPYGVGKVTGAGGLKKGSGMMIFIINYPQVKQEVMKLFTYTEFNQNHSGIVCL